jgi:hypothetical protein
MAELTTDPEEAALSFGIYMGVSREARYWRDTIGTLMRQVRTVPQESDTVLRLNLVYIVFGEQVQSDFEGIRYGRWWGRDRTLRLNAGVDEAGVVETPVEARRAILVGLLWDAVGDAEAYARKKRIADGLPEIRRVAGLLAAMPATDGQEKTAAELDEEPQWSVDYADVVRRAGQRKAERERKEREREERREQRARKAESGG